MACDLAATSGAWPLPFVHTHSTGSSCERAENERAHLEVVFGCRVCLYVRASRRLFRCNELVVDCCYMMVKNSSSVCFPSSCMKIKQAFRSLFITLAFHNKQKHRLF